MSPIILEFDGTKRNCEIPRTLAAVQEAIQANFPALSRHIQQISLRYTDDEGDDITVTTTDELEEAFNVAFLNGTLKLRILLPSDVHIDDINNVTAPESARARLGDNEANKNCESERYASDDANGVLKFLQKAGSTAIAEIQNAMSATQDEISNLFSQLDHAKTEHETTSSKLRSTETELGVFKHQVTNLEVHSNSLAAQVEMLTKQLSEASHQSSIHDAVLKGKDDEIQLLRSQLAECSSWEAKYKKVKAERDAALSNLQYIRTGLLGLTSNPPHDVCVNKGLNYEDVPASPCVSNVTLPPPYNQHDSEGAPSTPVLPSLPEARKTVKPLAEPTDVDNEIEKQLQQLSDLGKPMSRSELETRLQAVGGDFRILVSSLFA